MQPVNIGIIGLGNVGAGTLTILTENAAHIETKLGFPLRVAAVCSRGIAKKHLPATLDSALKTADWREVVNRPDVDIVVELIGGATTAREIIDAAIANGKSVVTANKELMALAGAELWDRAIAARINLAMEASVAGGSRRSWLLVTDPLLTPMVLITGVSPAWLTVRLTGTLRSYVAVMKRMKRSSEKM